MTRPIRELNDVQHHVFEIAAEQYARPLMEADYLRIAKQRAGQAERTTISGNAYRYAVEAAAALILAAEEINRGHLRLGMPALAPDFDL